MIYVYIHKINPCIVLGKGRAGMNIVERSPSLTSLDCCETNSCCERDCKRNFKICSDVFPTSHTRRLEFSVCLKIALTVP